MSTEFNHDGSITVIGYSLPEFCFELCDLAAKGFTVTMENDIAVSATDDERVMFYNGAETKADTKFDFSKLKDNEVDLLYKQTIVTGKQIGRAHV